MSIIKKKKSSKHEAEDEVREGGTTKWKREAAEDVRRGCGREGDGWMGWRREVGFGRRAKKEESTKKKEKRRQLTSKPHPGQ